MLKFKVSYEFRKWMEEAFSWAAQPLTRMESSSSSLVNLIQGCEAKEGPHPYKSKGNSDLISFTKILFKLFCNSKFPGFS